MGSKLGKKLELMQLSLPLILIVALMGVASNPSFAITSSQTKGFIYLDYIFYPTGKISNDININNNPDAREGDHIITFCSSEDDYGAIYWQYPDSDWDDSKGIDLRGVKKLEFMVKSKNGSENVLFAIGYPDSKYYVTKTVPKIPNNDWKRIEIQISPDKQNKMNKVAAGFGCIIKREDNKNGCTIYLKDIRYVL